MSSSPAWLESGNANPPQQAHDLHFSVTQNGVEDPTAIHDSPGMPDLPASGLNWGRLSQSSHPIVCIFHVLFKGLALFVYIFGGWFSKGSDGAKSGSNFIIVTVFCILLMAADFWVVKNITGRLLVGLRWWNRVDGDSTRWIFESAPKDSPVNKFDKSVFWTVLYATPVAWGALLFIGILKFNLQWLLIVFISLCLSGANVYGYYKCSSEQKARFTQMMQDGGQAAAMHVLQNGMSNFTSGVSSVSSGMMGILSGQGQQQQQQQQQTNQSQFV